MKWPYEFPPDEEAKVFGTLECDYRGKKLLIVRYWDGTWYCDDLKLWDLLAENCAGICTGYPWRDNARAMDAALEELGGTVTMRPEPPKTTPAEREARVKKLKEARDTRKGLSA